MNIRIVKLDLHAVESQLARIADLLEKIMIQTNPIPADWKMEDDPDKVVMYTNEDEIIIQEQLARMGREYKKR